MNVLESGKHAAHLQTHALEAAVRKAVTVIPLPVWSESRD